MKATKAKKIHNNLIFLYTTTILRFTLALNLMDEMTVYLSKPQLQLFSSIRNQFEEKLEKLIEIATINAKTLKLIKVENTKYVKVHSKIENAIDEIKKLNELIHQFTVSPKLPLEFFIFLDEIKPLLKFKNAEQIYNPSNAVVLFNSSYSYERADLLKHQYLKVDDIIFIPYLDVYNPLMWPCLLHEYGHVIARKHLDPVNSPKDEVEVKENCMGELLSDTFATSRMDASFIYATIVFYYSLGIEEFVSQGSHPNFIFRLEVMLKSMNKKSPFFTMVKKEIQSTLENAKSHGVSLESEQLEFKLAPRDILADFLYDPDKSKDNNQYKRLKSVKINREKIEKDTFKIYDSIIWDSEIPSKKISKNDCKILINNLANNIPIPSFVKKDNLDKIILEIDKFNTEKFTSNENNIAIREQILDMYEEERLNPVTIINLAWQTFLGPITDKIIDVSIQGNDVDIEKKKNDLINICSGFNNCILKSIESCQLVDIWRNYG